MANIPTPERIAEIQAIAQSNIEAKIRLQQEEGKDFVHDVYGPGVVPEDVWQAMKVKEEK